MRRSLLGCVFLLACSSEALPESEPAECAEPCVALDAPAQGFQLRTVGTDIAPGEDVEYCEVLEIPGERGEPVYVTRFEVAMSDYSHHLIVSAAQFDAPEEQDWNVGARTPCSAFDAIASEPVTASQHPYHDETFPDGVGRMFYGGQKVVFDYHYFNASSDPVAARAAVNFHTGSAEEVTRVAQQLSAFNLGIIIPPMQEASFTADCLVSDDIMLTKVTRHTHKWGRTFDIAFAGGARDGELIWTSPDYETTDYPMPEPTLIEAGTGLRFTCAFQNTTPETLFYGLQASDEMCNLFATWYVPNVGDEVSDQFCLLQ